MQYCTVGNLEAKAPKCIYSYCVAHPNAAAKIAWLVRRGAVGRGAGGRHAAAALGGSGAAARRASEEVAAATTRGGSGAAARRASAEGAAAATALGGSGAAERRRLLLRTEARTLALIRRRGAMRALPLAMLETPSAATRARIAPIPPTRAFGNATRCGTYPCIGRGEMTE